MEYRRKVPLESLRNDLRMYLKILQSALIELINKDYADFVNLSTNLVGLDKAINNLMAPLEQLKEEVQTAQKSVDDVVTALEEKLSKKTEIRNQKVCLQRLMCIIQSVEKIEKLVGITPLGDTDDSVMHSSELSGQLVERVATEFNKLQFHVNKCRGLPLVDEIRPRIASITTTLQFSLERSFRHGLETNDTEILRQCLRTYATIDKMRDAEQLFRLYIIRPYMEEVISEDFIKSHPQGLNGLYISILEFIPKHCSVLKEVTLGSRSSGGEIVRGYDFLVNAVWPEIISNIEARVPSIFAPGNPDVFHEKYTTSMQFVEKFEHECGSQASVKRLRTHPSYNIFMTKWNLPVYFQIRFQEIGGSFEMALQTPFNTTSEPGNWHLQCVDTLWQCLCHCWQDDIYLARLCHRFWKLSLQLLARYTTALADTMATESMEKGSMSKMENDSNGGSSAASRDPVVHGNSQKVAPSQPPMTTSQIVALLADTQKLVEKLPGFYVEVVQPRLEQLGVQNMDLLKESLEEAQEALESPLSRMADYIIEDITTQSCVHLKLVSDTPRLYRRTNREVPTKASMYVAGLFKPIQRFLGEHETMLTRTNRDSWMKAVLQNLSSQYLTVTSDMLTSVKKMEESLKRLKKAKSGSGATSQGLSDDDKIRLQLYLDVKQFGEKIESLGLESSSIEAYQKLYELVASASNNLQSANPQTSLRTT